MTDSSCTPPFGWWQEALDVAAEGGRKHALCRAASHAYICPIMEAVRQLGPTWADYSAGRAAAGQRTLIDAAELSAGPCTCVAGRCLPHCVL